MIKENKWRAIFSSIVILLPVLVAFFGKYFLPEEIAMNWGLDGNAVLVILPCILLALHWLCLIVTVILDKNAQQHNKKIMAIVFWIIPAISVLIAALTYSAAMGKNAPVEVITNILVGLVLVIMGNYLPKCRQSYTVGIKLPWTLNNEENWARTHRLAGWVWTVGGIVMLLLGFLGIFWLTLVPAIIMVAVPFIYSYILHKKGI